MTGNLAIFYTVMLVIYEWYSNDMAVSEDVVPFRFGPGALRYRMCMGCAAPEGWLYWKDRV